MVARLFPIRIDPVLVQTGRLALRRNKSSPVGSSKVPPVNHSLLVRPLQGDPKAQQQNILGEKTHSNAHILSDGCSVL